jgi:hypothetical protein
MSSIKYSLGPATDIAIEILNISEDQAKFELSWATGPLLSFIPVL